MQPPRPILTHILYKENSTFLKNIFVVLSPAFFARFPHQCVTGFTRLCSELNTELVRAFSCIPFRSCCGYADIFLQLMGNLAVCCNARAVTAKKTANSLQLLG